MNRFINDFSKNNGKMIEKEIQKNHLAMEKERNEKKRNISTTTTSLPSFSELMESLSIYQSHSHYIC